MIMLIFFIVIIVLCVVMIRYTIKNKVGLNVASAITLRPGETRITSLIVSWKHKAFYVSRHSIPQGTLDITDQRIVFTATSGTKVNFEVEKDDIASVRSAGLFMDIRTKSGDSYLVGTSWKKELKGYLQQMGVPVE
ncbi:MAG TPA: hypothetical protein H9943_08950 [Candidatus Ruthenibacterium avium]|uniref:Uncharacterized protein n=1 Tax=Candidatus Ruthenibacterium avium TaxID=2838751 RepID=A0A9D2M3I4_9FIRM|nr:hypothetical protein [Candidatus Ruthenibacterium avium]